jgi:transposase
LADKGYDTKCIVEKVQEIGALTVIPSRSNSLNPRKYDKNLYKQRNLVERFYGKIKHFRRIATRYDKLAVTFMSFLYFVGIFIWIK